jgi:hypothetical protein
MLTRNYVNNSLFNIKTLEGGSLYRSPADIAIVEFGGVTKLAKAVNVSKASVSKWRSFINEDGQQGLIPSWALPKVLQISKKRSYKISAEDLILGRRE